MTSPTLVGTRLTKWEKSLQTKKKNATKEINKVVQQRKNQIMSQGGKEVERELPKILRAATEDVYQTHFRLLEKFGKKQLNKLKRKILG